MQFKKIATFGLLCFVGVSIAFMVVREQGGGPDGDGGGAGPNEAVRDDAAVYAEGSESGGSVEGEADAAKKEDVLVVYYFHGNVRCATCRKLETYTREALESYFESELSSGEIMWKAVNVDESGNEHYVQDYNLVTKSVVLSRMRDGEEQKWENLDRIWREVGDKKGYLAYIRESVAEFMAAGES